MRWTTRSCCATSPARRGSCTTATSRACSRARPGCTCSPRRASRRASCTIRGAATCSSAAGGRESREPRYTSPRRGGLMAAIRRMGERYTRPDWVRRLNAMGDSVGGPLEGARRLVPIDADALREEAERSLGGSVPKSDFGDPDWRKRFETLARALDASPLHVVGRLLTKQALLRSLRSRPLLCRAAHEKPAIADDRIEAPAIVTGPARSGTSITFELFWLAPTLRAPLAWEALHPLPFAGEDRRPAWSECEQELWADVQPEFAAVHELRSDLPVECVTLTAPCFGGPHWTMVSQAAGLPDPVLMYDFHRRILQVLQHGAPRRNWLLKTPGHLATPDLLFDTYPHARLLHTETA